MMDIVIMEDYYEIVCDLIMVPLLVTFKVISSVYNYIHRKM